MARWGVIVTGSPYELVGIDRCETIYMCEDKNDEHEDFREFIGECRKVAEKENENEIILSYIGKDEIDACLSLLRSQYLQEPLCDFEDYVWGLANDDLWQDEDIKLLEEWLKPLRR